MSLGAPMRLAGRPAPAWLVPAALALGVIIGAAAAVQTRQQQPDAPDAGAAALTAADYVQIEQLVNRYGYVLDRCERGGYAYADLYSADGVFIDMWSDLGVARNGIRWEGREQLAEAAGGGPDGCPPRGRRSINHLTVNLVITPTGEGATGISYLISGGGGGDRDVLQRADVYEDIYVRTPDGWRFKQRTHLRDRDAGRFPAGIAPRQR